MGLERIQFSVLHNYTPRLFIKLRRLPQRRTLSSTIFLRCDLLGACIWHHLQAMINLVCWVLSEPMQSHTSRFFVENIKTTYKTMSRKTSATNLQKNFVPLYSLAVGTAAAMIVLFLLAPPYCLLPSPVVYLLWLWARDERSPRWKENFFFAHLFRRKTTPLFFVVNTEVYIYSFIVINRPSAKADSFAN